MLHHAQHSLDEHILVEVTCNSRRLLIWQAIDALELVGNPEPLKMLGW